MKDVQNRLAIPDIQVFSLQFFHLIKALHIASLMLSYHIIHEYVVIKPLLSFELP